MLHHILEHHTSFLASDQSSAQLHGSVKMIRKNHHQLTMYSHMLESISLRTISYMDRLKNQIGFTFNLVAQNEAYTSIQIAKATKADSQTMKLTSLVALVFLPAMFVSAVFSTTFFDLDSDRGRWAMSDQFYIHWAFVVPVEAISIALWYLLVYKKYEIIAKKIDLREKHLRTKIKDDELFGYRF